MVTENQYVLAMDKQCYIGTRVSNMKCVEDVCGDICGHMCNVCMDQAPLRTSGCVERNQYEINIIKYL